MTNDENENLDMESENNVIEDKILKLYICDFIENIDRRGLLSSKIFQKKYSSNEKL